MKNKKVGPLDQRNLSPIPSRYGTLPYLGRAPTNPMSPSHETTSNILEARTDQTKDQSAFSAHQESVRTPWPLSQKRHRSRQSTLPCPISNGNLDPDRRSAGVASNSVSIKSPIRGWGHFDQKWGRWVDQSVPDRFWSPEAVWYRPGLGSMVAS